MTSYKRKSERGSGLPENMEEAYGIPRATLGRRVIGKNKIAKDAVKHLGRYIPVFDIEFERELKEYDFLWSHDFSA